MGLDVRPGAIGVALFDIGRMARARVQQQEAMPSFCGQRRRAGAGLVVKHRLLDLVRSGQRLSGYDQPPGLTAPVGGEVARRRGIEVKRAAPPQLTDRAVFGLTVHVEPGFQEVCGRLLSGFAARKSLQRHDLHRGMIGGGDFPARVGLLQPSRLRVLRDILVSRVLEVAHAVSVMIIERAQARHAHRFHGGADHSAQGRPGNDPVLAAFAKADGLDDAVPRLPHQQRGLDAPSDLEHRRQTIGVGRIQPGRMLAGEVDGLIERREAEGRLGKRVFGGRGRQGGRRALPRWRRAGAACGLQRGSDLALDLVLRQIIIGEGNPVMIQ